MSKVYMQGGRLVVPDCVTVPFIEGDGVGAEISSMSANRERSSQTGLQR